MQIKDFVKSVLLELNEAVDEARQQTSRDIVFTNTDGKRTVEFDIAVTAEDTTESNGKAGVKVMSFVEAGGNLAKGSRNSTVSRIQFGVRVDSLTKAEDAEQTARIRSHNQRAANSNSW